MRLFPYLFGLDTANLSRARFLIANCCALGLFIPLASAILFLKFSFNIQVEGWLATAIGLAFAIFSQGIFIVSATKRTRDIPISSRWVVLTVVPLVNLIFFIFLCWKPPKLIIATK
jgi:uncharacterized membrane protein YhaH (DUF805 family)